MKSCIEIYRTYFVWEFLQKNSDFGVVVESGG